MVFNNYGLGEDAVGIPNRSRLHTDDSVEIKYYDRPDCDFLDKAAFSPYGGPGLRIPGGGVSCTGKGGNPKQAFLGYMFTLTSVSGSRRISPWPDDYRRRPTQQSWTLSSVLLHAHQRGDRDYLERP